MTEFNFVPQQEIRNWWPTIKPGLDEIKLKSPEPWIVEDVYVDLFNQKSMLWIALENMHFVGFFILQPLGHEVHVWAAWTLENDYQVVEKGLQFIKNMARNSNAKYLTFSSHRRGWDRRAKAYGFRPRKWICEV
jgi:DNA modification methylase